MLIIVSVIWQMFEECLSGLNPVARGMTRILSLNGTMMKCLKNVYVRFEPGSPVYDTYPKSKRNNDEMIDLRRNQEDLQLR